MNYKLDKSVGRLTKDVSYLIGKLLSEKFKEAGLEVDVMEWMVLTYLINLGPLTQNELAGYTGRDKVAIKRIIDKLEGKRYARRKKNKLDRRYNKVIISKKGREIYPKLKEKAQQTLQITYGDLETEQVEKCIETLKKFQQNIEGALEQYDLLSNRPWKQAQ